jgi:hypothetical protein
MKKLLLAAVALGLGILALSFQEPAKAQTNAERDAANAKVVAAQKPSYPLDTCVISGKKLGEMGAPIEHVVGGRLVRLCCKNCVATVDKDSASVLKKVDEAVVLAQKPIYPLDTCVVSGEKLGGMGDPVNFVDGTRLVRFCCDGCVAGYKKDPAAYMAKVDAALIAKLRTTYALSTCPVSGEELGSMGEPIDMLYGVQLVRLCCKGCIKSFEKDPAAALAKVAAAKKTNG